ncbi:MAG TPA: class I adenylate-forming enzyme family protein [Usitatibacter sp.]|nr:class I adenylate-forming enzyme family protein [Usitatibacter sp.]
MNAERLDAPFGNLADLVREIAREQPGHPALVQGERVLDYASFDAAVDRVAAALQQRGVAPRDAVAICAGTSIEYLVVFLACLRIGAAAALISPFAGATTVARMVADSGARVSFVDTPTARALDEAGLGLAAEVLAIEDLASLGTAGAQPAAVAVEPDWPFNIIYSSGTTGEPKGIVQPHSMRWTHLQRGPIYGYDTNAITLVSTPLYSNTTLVSVFPTLGLGGTVVLMPKFDVVEFLALAERHRVTHTMLVPVQYRRIMAQPDFSRFDLGAFRAKFSTSAPFAAALKEDVLARWPGGLVELYGMTEGGGTCVLAAHLHPGKLHTVGIPAPNSEIRIIDDEGRELPRGESGEIVGRSPAMMSGYHRQPELTRKALWHDAEGRPFIRTGDVGRFDADGFLVLVDRKKDMIISGGFNVYSSDLEAVVARHPEVAEVAVVGVHSDRWGETPVAFVVPRRGTVLDAPALLSWANAQLGKVQRLSDVRVVEELPRSPIGKVLKRELRDAYRPA